MRYLTVPFQVKALGARQLEGYASTFGNVDLGGDIVVPGAFADSIAAHAAAGTMPKMLWNHDAYSPPIGIWTSMEEDRKGLRMVGEFAETSMGNDIRTLAMMGAVDRFSIGYYPIKVGFDEAGNRLLKQIDVEEVSPVNFPMNPRAVIEGVKSMFNPRSLEHQLRECGRTRAEAKEVVHEIYQRDASKSRRDDGSVETCDAQEMVLETANELATQLMLASIQLPNFNT